MIDVSLVLVEIAPLGIRPGIFRFEPDRFVEIGERVVGIRLAEINVAAIEIGCRLIAVGADRFIAICQSPIGIFFGPPPSAAIAERCGAILR
jgi:hypothetical protein